MLKSESDDSRTIEILDLNYIDKLKDKVLEEIIERIEKKMDVNAADILDVARSKLGVIKQHAPLIALLLKPVYLIFLVELYLESPVSI